MLPYRRTRFCAEEATELGRYFTTLEQANCEILMVDGSPPEVFARNAETFRERYVHVPVDRRFGYLNDKVNGIHTGLDLARSERIVLADDDIRYTPGSLRQIVTLLNDYEVVRPQNFLSPLPWWARMEAARMLINRAVLRAADYPGTCAFLRGTMAKTGPYDGDVLFDNEEIIRHFAKSGCKVAYANNLFVRKRPPVFRKWLEQRPRQAYEDFGMRAKTALFCVLLPSFFVVATFGGLRGLASLGSCVIVASVGLALCGRARGRARQFVPLSCCWHAPLWIMERTLSTYWALYWYFTRGGYPFGGQVLAKGVGIAWKDGGRVANELIHEQER